jgi:hypothetical protein
MNVLPKERRAATPCIAIEPSLAGYSVRIDGEEVRLCASELDAHHWGMHAFEAVNQGLRRPREIDRAMGRLCLVATKLNLHH